MRFPLNHEMFHWKFSLPLLNIVRRAKRLNFRGIFFLLKLVLLQYFVCVTWFFCIMNPRVATKMHLPNSIKCFMRCISFESHRFSLSCELMARTQCITSKNFENFRYDENWIWKVWCWNRKSFHHNLTINPLENLHVCYNTHTMCECSLKHHQW